MYITTPLAPRYPQIPMDALFDFNEDISLDRYKPVCDPSATTTSVRDKIPANVYQMWRPERLLNALKNFVDLHADVVGLRDYRPLYNHYEIPKKNGKTRPIDEPLPPLRAAQDQLVQIIEACMPATHHSAAYAYVKQRETLDAVKKHQSNDSHWFAKFDFTNFFGSTTPAFLENMLAQIYPFSWLNEQGEWEVVSKALSVCFLRGGLPQGSPASPLLTNIMMIPIDYALNKTLHNFDRRSFIYTRYADDIQISCKVDFDVKVIERLITDTLKQFNAPFHLNREKTHYGSRAGRNWMLGIKLNAENKTTVGYMNKKFMKAMLTNYVLDRKKGPERKWTLNEIQTMSGNLSYYRHVEQEYFDQIVTRLGEKFGVNIDAAIKEDIKAMSA